MKTDNFQFSSDEIATACLSWPWFTGFSGENCAGCGRTANVMSGLNWVCVCGVNNVMGAGFKIAHDNPDLGPTIKTIIDGYESAKDKKNPPSRPEQGALAGL